MQQSRYTWIWKSKQEEEFKQRSTLHLQGAFNIYKGAIYMLFIEEDWA